MKELIEQASNRKIFFFLTFAFLAFYTVQIPLVTSNADVMTFSCRALSHLPITRYAYLDERSLLGQPPLPNYHCAHTAVLWLAYHVFPSGISRTIWPSGFVSALCGALCAGLTFLIWFRLGFGKPVSFTSAAIAGLLPAIWNMSVIGEPYSMQLASTLLFLYCFLADRMVLATAAFVFSVCVSPIAGLSFSLVFLAPPTKRTIVKAVVCGSASLLLYFLIMHLLKIDVLAAFSAITPPRQDRSVVWKIYSFLLIFILNVNFMFPQLVRGSKILWSQYRGKTLGLFLAIVPWVLLAAKDFQFLDLPGNFLLMIFWALGLPVGLALARSYYPVRRYFLIFLGVLCTYIVFCYFPDINVGIAKMEAGNQLRNQVPQDVKIIGLWSCGVPLTLTKYGWNLEKLSGSYFEADGGNLTDSIMSKTGEKSLLIVIRKEDKVHRRLKAWGMPGLQTRNFDQKDFKITGAVRKVLENDAVIAYTWDKDTTGSRQ
jgi:hypothetical protein